MSDQRTEKPDVLQAREDTIRRLNRRCQELEHSLALETGKSAWYGYWTAAFQLFKEEATKVETLTAENATLRQRVERLTSERDYFKTKYAQKLDAEREYLMMLQQARTKLLEELLEFSLGRVNDGHKSTQLAGDHYTYRDVIRIYGAMAEEIERFHVAELGYAESIKITRAIRDKMYAARATESQEEGKTDGER